jgi:GrpB-like predicted nucleotidyltransferase (UPF0157 family)
MSRVELIPYSKRWADEFRHIATELRAALAGLALGIDHIGSTAVPGLAAKDVIDVQVAVASLDLEPLAPPLTTIGYEHVARINRDHVPPGATTGQDQWLKLLFQRRSPRRAVNVHVRLAAAANALYALLFRDYLRAHPRAAAAYGELKQKLALLEPPLSLGDYTELKDSACDLVTAAAEEWAAQKKWQPGPSAA